MFRRTCCIRRWNLDDQCRMHCRRNLRVVVDFVFVDSDNVDDYYGIIVVIQMAVLGEEILAMMIRIWLQTLVVVVVVSSLDSSATECDASP